MKDKNSKIKNPVPKVHVKQEPVAAAVPGKKLVRQLSFVVAIIGFLLYANTLTHGYVYDDHKMILEDTTTQKGFSGIIEIFKTPYWSSQQQTYQHTTYRPVSKALLAIEWGMSHGNPKAGHLMNVLLYCLTGFVLMSTLHLFFKSLSLSFIISLLFIAHPIHTEAIANIKSSDEILSFLFSILALRSSYHFFTTSKTKHVVYSLLFFLLAMFSKESSVVMPGLFLLTWYFFYPVNLKQLSVSMMGYISIAGFYIWMRHLVVGNIFSSDILIQENSLVAAPDLLHRLPSAIFIMGKYIQLLVFPHPLVFSYGFNQIPILSAGDVWFIISFVFLLVVFVVAVAHIKRKLLWAYGVLFFFIASSLISNIFILIGTEMNERLMYLPSLGFCIVLGYFLFRWFHLKENKLSVLKLISGDRRVFSYTFLILILFSFKTISRNADWKSNYTLFSHDIELSPKSSQPHLGLGNYLLNEAFSNRVDANDMDSVINRGISELNKARSILPGNLDALNALGVAYYNTKKFNEASRTYREALTYFSNDATIYNNLGIVLLDMQNYQEAENALRKAVQLKPDYQDAYINLVSSLDSLKKYPEAIAVLDSAARRFPGNNDFNLMLTSINQKAK